MGDSGTALLDRKQLEWRLRDGRQVDSVAGQETTGLETARQETSGQLEWRLLDGRQLDSVAGQGTTGQRCWTGDIWTAGVETARRETAGQRCLTGDSWSGDC